jgi:aspartate ammonia-lyase
MMSIIYLRRSCRVLREFCIEGITANEEFLRTTVENSIGLVTALAPKLGYEAASAIAKHAQKTGKTVRESALELGLMTSEEFDQALGDVDRLTGQG